MSRITMSECCMIGFGDGGERVQGCSPSGAVVGGNGECAEFAVPPGEYLLIPLDGIDVERVRTGSQMLRQCIRPIEGKPKELLKDTLDSLDRVLAAIDGDA